MVTFKTVIKFGRYFFLRLLRTKEEDGMLFFVSFFICYGFSIVTNHCLFITVFRLMIRYHPNALMFHPMARSFVLVCKEENLVDNFASKTHEKYCKNPINHIRSYNSFICRANLVHLRWLLSVYFTLIARIMGYLTK